MEKQVKKEKEPLPESLLETLITACDTADVKQIQKIANKVKRG